jgi:hypothetical protein
MNSKKILILTISTCLVLSFIGCGEKNKANKSALLVSPSISYNVLLMSNMGEELSSISDISEEEKTKIARDLFDKYINDNRTDLKQVEFQKIDRKPVVCFTEYKINDVKATGGDGDNFTVNIKYDIKYTNESDIWIAGNGEISNDNWIRNKSNFVEIQKDGDNYVISNIITG